MRDDYDRDIDRHTQESASPLLICSVAAAVVIAVGIACWYFGVF